MAVSKRLRYEILRRDNHTCRYCGDAAPNVALTVDHVIPTALGGSDQPDNLVTACQPCNAGKSATSPEAPVVTDVASDALRWAAAMKAAQQLRIQARDERERHREYFHDVWLTHYGDDRDLHTSWGTTVDDLIEAGLAYDDFEDAVEITAQYMRRDPFRYFCGVCWNKVSELQAIARSVLSQEDI